MNVYEAVASRRSVREFLDRPVSPEVIRRVLQKALRAPSGGNLQPWHLHVVGGERLDALKAIMRTRVQEMPTGEGTEFSVEDRMEGLDGVVAAGIAQSRLIVSVGALAIPDVVRLAGHALDRRVDSLLLMPPCVYRGGITEWTEKGFPLETGLRNSGNFLKSQDQRP